MTRKPDGKNASHQNPERVVARCPNRYCGRRLEWTAHPARGWAPVLSGPNDRACEDCQTPARLLLALRRRAGVPLLSEK